LRACKHGERPYAQASGLRRKVLSPVQDEYGSGDRIIFITLNKFRRKPTKEIIAESQKLFEQAAKEGLKVLGFYWTLGRFDSVLIAEWPDEKTAMKATLRWGDMLSTETLVAVPREEALKLLE